MYANIYNVFFRDVDDSEYKIEILQEGYIGSSLTLTAGTPSFKLSINDDSFLYTPTRLGNATLKIVHDNQLLDLYAGNYQKNKVNLYKGSSLIWTGFITPESYTQEYSSYLQEIEIEAVSAFATLEYIDYEYINNNGFVSLFQLFKEAITRSKGDYRYLFVPNSYSLKMADMIVSEGNFFDEEGKPMSYKEIIEEIAKYLQFTITEHNGNLYCIDVDFVKKGKTSYQKYDIQNNFAESTVQFTSSNTIQNIGYSSSNNTVSVIGAYNKVNIKCSDYEYSDLYPELNDEIITSVSDYSTKTDTIGKKTGSTFRRETHQDTFKCHQYQINGSTLTETTGVNFDTIPAGCKTIQLCSFDNENEPNKLNFENMFEIRLFSGQTYNSANNLLDTFTNTKVITLKKDIPALVFSSDYKLGIDFKLKFSDRSDYNAAYNLPYFTAKNDADKVGTSSLLNGWYIPVSVKIGNKYYDNELNGWTTIPTICKLTTDLKKDKQHFTFDWLNAKDTNDYTLNVGNLSGHIFDLNDRNIGKLEVIVYCPIQEQDRYERRYCYIKDFTVKAQRITDIKKTDYTQSDTLYESSINDSYTNELEDIELKLTSNNSSELALSRVATQNQSTLNNNIPVDAIINNIGYSVMKLEELLINRIIDQYKNQKINLKCDLTYNGDIMPYTIISEYGRTYIMCGGDIDFSDKVFSINLIEIN